MSSEATYADWIAVDWGTSHLRAWAMRSDAPIAAATSDAGMGKLSRDGFEPALLSLIDPWLGLNATEVIVCGMAGSRQGWKEAPYVPVPCAVGHLPSVAVETASSKLAVRIVSGIRQDTPADVMRGEETQIAGYLALNPEFDGILCLPGTHTKWVHISAGEIVSFRTFMTGEMFSLLSKYSVLKHSVGDGWDTAAFGAAVTETLSRPESLAARLFSVRADGLLNGTETDAATATVSGLLIGAELAAARAYWLGQRVVLIGAEELSVAYGQALASQGVVAERADATDMTLNGLAAHRASLREHAS
ncbi:MAG: 2-dehydro-3-deoxygalactonokinase [Rhodobacteraceae bacterium]|nr:2-dehydro-3-deoxygalactonokinase [Paracoccaceae bacterium]